MKIKISSLFLRKTENWIFWILLALLVKGLFFCFLLYTNTIQHTYPGFWGAIGADTHDYLAPIENLIIKGEYTPDHRMPGYGIIYLPILLFFSKTVALNFLITFQYLAAAVSVYLLALIAKHIFLSDKYFYVVYYLFLISVYSNFYDIFLLTESLTCSFLIFTNYFFIRAFLEKKNLCYFISGVFLTEVIFLRPVFFPLLFLYLIMIIWNNFPVRKTVLSAILFFTIPLSIVELGWVLHNYKQHNRIQLLMDTFLPGELNENYYKPSLEFCQSWGGNYIWWKEGNPIRWFGVGINETGDSLDSLIKKEKIKIPKDIYTSKFNTDSLMVLRNLISEIKKEEMYSRSIEVEKKEKIVKLLFNKYTKSIKAEKSFIYNIKSRINYCKYYFLTTRSNNPFANSKNYFFLLLKKAEFFYYGFILVSGIIGIILLIIEFLKNRLILIVIGIPIYTILIHPFVLRLIENRYLMPSYPFLILSSGYCIIHILTFLKNRLFYK